MSGIPINTPHDSPKWRNARGSELELVGAIDEAIELYECNVREKFDGPHPYDRLRIIYERKQEFASAIRVCRAAIEALEDKPSQAKRFEKAIVRLRRRSDWRMLDIGLRSNH